MGKATFPLMRVFKRDILSKVSMATSQGHLRTKPSFPSVPPSHRSQLTTAKLWQIAAMWHTHYVSLSPRLKFWLHCGHCWISRTWEALGARASTTSRVSLRLQFLLLTGQIVLLKEGLAKLISADHNSTRWGYFDDPRKESCRKERQTERQIGTGVDMVTVFKCQNGAKYKNRCRHKCLCLTSK